MSLIWMPLYVADYLKDTRRLTTLQHGAYMLLIMEYWTAGSLPTDDATLAQIAGLSSQEWSKNRSAIERLFRPGWKHKRVEEELAKAAEKSGKAKKSAKRRWESYVEPEQDWDANAYANAYANAPAIACPEHMLGACYSQSQAPSQDLNVSSPLASPVSYRLDSGELDAGGGGAPKPKLVALSGGRA